MPPPKKGTSVVKNNMQKIEAASKKYIFKVLLFVGSGFSGM